MANPNFKGRQLGSIKKTSTIIDPATLDINHIDGNNGNRDPSNIEILCKMCHSVVTIRNEHHKQPTPSRRAKLEKTDLFEFG
jgi:5-methylcytosine-specific restriction endonuclease McrA